MMNMYDYTDLSRYPSHSIPFPFVLHYVFFLALLWGDDRFICFLWRSRMGNSVLSLQTLSIELIRCILPLPLLPLVWMIWISLQTLYYTLRFMIICIIVFLFLSFLWSSKQAQSWLSVWTVWSSTSISFSTVLNL